MLIDPARARLVRSRLSSAGEASFGLKLWSAHNDAFPDWGAAEVGRRSAAFEAAEAACPFVLLQGMADDGAL